MSCCLGWVYILLQVFRGGLGFGSPRRPAHPRDRGRTEGRPARVIARRLLAAGLSLAALHGWAQQTPIVVGQSCDLSGATAPRVKEFVKGVDAYIAQVNAQGGVNGRQIKLVRYDDGFNTEKGLANAKRLVEQDEAMVFFGMGSAPVTAAVLPYAEAKGVPLFGSLSGADSLRQPRPLLFHFRASFGEEINRIAQHFSTLGIKRIAALASDAPIGQDGVVALEQAAKTHGLEVVKVARVSADMKNLNDSAAAIAQAQPNAVLVLAPSGPAIKFIEALKKNQVTAQLAGLSVMSIETLYKALGSQVQGMIISQVVPFPWNARIGIVRDFQKLMSESQIAPSIDSMEGYVSARLLVEGLKAAAQPLTRKSFVAALEATKRRDLGGLSVAFAPADHSLVQFVDITMIGSGGKLIN